MPARTASSTTYWIAGRSTTGSISFGCALVAGRNRVPNPAAGTTAFAHTLGHRRSPPVERPGRDSGTRAHSSGSGTVVATLPVRHAAVPRWGSSPRRSRPMLARWRAITITAHPASAATSRPGAPSAPAAAGRTATAAIEPSDTVRLSVVTTPNAAADTSRGEREQHQRHAGNGGHALAAPENTSPAPPARATVEAGGGSQAGRKRGDVAHHGGDAARHAQAVAADRPAQRGGHRTLQHVADQGQHPGPRARRCGTRWWHRDCPTPRRWGRRRGGGSPARRWGTSPGGRSRRRRPPQRPGTRWPRVARARSRRGDRTGRGASLGTLKSRVLIPSPTANGDQLSTSGVQMPTYEYRCRDCGEPLEVVQSFTDDPLTVCPACGGELRKVFKAVGIAFKGCGLLQDRQPEGGQVLGVLVGLGVLGLVRPEIDAIGLERRRSLERRAPSPRRPRRRRSSSTSSSSSSSTAASGSA